MKRKKDKKKLKKEKAKFLAEWWQMAAIAGHISYEKYLEILSEIIKKYNLPFKELFNKK